MLRGYDGGVVAEIPPKELEAWRGPVNWNTHHDVLKDSANSPDILVIIYSFINGNTAHNELLVKGPNILNSFFSNLIEFRIYEVTLVWDISTTYNSLK